MERRRRTEEEKRRKREEGCGAQGGGIDNKAWRTFWLEAVLDVGVSFSTVITNLTCCLSPHSSARVSLFLLLCYTGEIQLQQGAVTCGTVGTCRFLESQIMEAWVIFCVENR